MEVGLQPVLTPIGKPLRRVVAVDERLIKKLRVFGQVVDVGDQVEPESSYRLVVGARTASAFSDAPDAGNQAAERLRTRITVRENPGDMDVFGVRKIGILDFSGLKRLDEGVKLCIHTV